MIVRVLSATNRYAPLLRMGLIAGLVTAVALYPLAALAGAKVKSGTAPLEDLPGDVTERPPAETTYVYAADGETLLTAFYEEHRRYTPFAQISPHMRNAIVASEDARFFEHHGVDTKGIARAFVANTQSGDVEQGASTLTMQYVRMALRDSAATPAEVRAATEQTVTRKLREARLAVDVERELTKPEILERYLNRAYFGHRAYGIYAAAEIFFSKHPRDLDVAESATLAGLVKSPTAYDPASQDQAAATERRNWVLDRMVELGYIPASTAEEARSAPIELDLSDPVNGCVSVDASHNDWGFFCDFFRNWWLSQDAFGSDPLEREERLRRGGYRVVTSLDPEIQQIAQDHVLAKEGIGSPYAHGSVALEPGTGLVKAMAVNRTYSLDQSDNGPHTRGGDRVGNYPNTVTPLLGGGSLVGYQAGSTFKWFVLLAALEQEMPLATKIRSPHRYVSSYLSGSGAPASCGNRWCPSNANEDMAGTHTMWSGFGQSVNTFFVQLQERVGADRAVEMAERLGLHWRSEADQRLASGGRAEGWGSFTLGTADTTPLEMAGAYAVGAADGTFCAPLPVLSIKDRHGDDVTVTTADGEEVPVARHRCRQAVSPEVARAATDAALCPTGSGATQGSCGDWTTAGEVSDIVDRQVAGKTGTTDGNRTAWFVGYTPELSVASFTADPDNPFHAVGGGRASQSIHSTAQILRDALADRPEQTFTPPEQLVG